MGGYAIRTVFGVVPTAVLIVKGPLFANLILIYVCFVFLAFLRFTLKSSTFLFTSCIACWQLEADPQGSHASS